MNFVHFIQRKKKLMTIIASVVIATLLCLTFVVPLVVKPIAEKKLSASLKRIVTIRSIALNPLQLSVKISGLVIKERTSSDIFASFEKLYVNLQSVSLIKKGLILKALQLDSLYVHAVRKDDSTYNFSDLLKQPQQEKKSDNSPFRFSLNNIIISNANIAFVDNPKQTSHNVRNIQITIPFLSNFNYYTGIYCTPSFSANINGTPLELKSKTKPFDKTMETVIDMNIDTINLAQYIAYIPQQMNFKLGSALLSANGRFTFKLNNGKPYFDYSGDCILDSLDLKTRSDSSILSITSIGVKVKSAELVSSNINLASITITRPLLHVSRSLDGSISLMKLLPADTVHHEVSVKDTMSASKMSLTVDRLALHGGEIFFRDSAVTKPQVQHIDSLSVDLSHFVLNDRFDFNLYLRNNLYQQFACNGSFAFSPLSITGTCKLDSLTPGSYMAYIPAGLDIEIKSGYLNLTSGFSFNQHDSVPLVITQNGMVHCANWVILRRSTREELLRFKNLDFINASFDLTKNLFTLDSILSSKMTVFGQRTGATSFNFTELIKDTASNKDTNHYVSESIKQQAPALSYAIGSVQLKEYRFIFQDMTTDEKDSISLDKINLSINGLSSEQHKNASIRFNAALNSNGSIAMTGKLAMNPMRLESRLNLNNISIKPVQAYLNNNLNIALTDGTLDINGNLTYMQADSASNMVYKGDIAVHNFATINKENADNFLLWKSLKFNNVSFSQNPFIININQIVVGELYSLFKIYSDGKTNLQAILKKDSTAVAKDTTLTTQSTPDDTTRAKSAVIPVISIDSVTLDDCNINFSDFRFSNVFSANMKNLSGTIRGLSSSQDKKADIRINGNYDATSPITISGAINPLAKKLFLDVGLKFKDIDITQMNPYSQKYLGYVIRKGKLSLDLRYFVENNSLNSTNSIFLNKLTLGEEVKSPDATSLPVKFALALLKDQNGDINLDVPVTGSLDDPKFNVGKILLQVFGNIVKKAVASPFAALSGLFGGSDELSYAEFDGGSSVLSASVKEKLDKIIKGLTQRSDLIVEIQGFTDPDIDREQLKKQMFMRKLRAIKLKDLLKKSDGNVLVDTITILPGEYQKYLEKAFDKESFKKPRKLVPSPTTGITGTMEKLMYDNIQVTENELRLLASSRTLAVKEYLVTKGHVDIANIFMLEGKNNTPDVKENVKNSRAEFTLKTK
jgi:hypothetical protein